MLSTNKATAPAWPRSGWDRPMGGIWGKEKSPGFVWCHTGSSTTRRPVSGPLQLVSYREHQGPGEDFFLRFNSSSTFSDFAVRWSLPGQGPRLLVVPTLKTGELVVSEARLAGGLGLSGTVRTTLERPAPCPPGSPAAEVLEQTADGEAQHSVFSSDCLPCPRCGRISTADTYT